MNTQISNQFLNQIVIIHYNKKKTAKAVKENNMKSTAFDMAMMAYRQNDMEGAFRQFLPLAETGDAEYGSKYV